MASEFACEEFPQERRQKLSSLDLGLAALHGICIPMEYLGGQILWNNTEKHIAKWTDWHTWGLAWHPRIDKCVWVARCVAPKQPEMLKFSPGCKTWSKYYSLTWKNTKARRVPNEFLTTLEVCSLLVLEHCWAFFRLRGGTWAVWQISYLAIDYYSTWHSTMFVETDLRLSFHCWI